MTQGRGDGTEWVTAFMVSYSLDAFQWQYVSDQYGNQRVSMNQSLNIKILTFFILFYCYHWFFVGFRR